MNYQTRWRNSSDLAVIDRSSITMNHRGDPVRLTLTQAASETGTSLSTIKRRLRGGAFPNAGQDHGGRWLIPVTDLIAAGLRPGRPAPPDPLPDSVTQVGDLAAENAELRTRLAVAEALAEERNRIIGVQERMLAMLEAGSSKASSDQGTAEQIPPAPSPAASPPAAIQTSPGITGWVRSFFA